MAQRNDSEFEKVWQDLAEEINNLPRESRERYRQELGQFMHDMKHTLGLVINANEIAIRDVADDPDNDRSMEMLDIIRTAASQLNQHLDVIVGGCLNRIEIEE